MKYILILLLLVNVAEAANPKCHKRINRPDGPGGFLWKPVSDSGSLVVLFPREYSVPFKFVRVYRTGKKKPKRRVETLRFTGFHNDDRQHWRGVLQGGDYTGRIRVKNGRKVCRWRVRKPKFRAD